MPRLIDPTIARAVARRFTADSELMSSYLVERLQRDLEQAVPRAEELVAQASGIPSPEPVAWALVDRSTWAEANIDGMARLMAPLADKVAHRLEALPLPVRIAQRLVVSSEVGILLGYVSRRVLGQYDLLVPETARTAGANPRRRNRKLGEGTVLYFVGPNMLETERRFSFVPYDFALWVALHEVTHRFQFAGVPWLKERFFKLVNSYLGSIDLDTRALAGRFAAAVTKVASREARSEERNVMYLLADDEQRELLDQIQALMAVVEGHGNFVMDSVGAEVIPSFRRMRHIFERRRRQTNVVQRAIHHVLGLEMKMRQYELGQSFCEEVARRQGQAALAELWQGPERFPTLAELRDPDLWLRRVA